MSASKDKKVRKEQIAAGTDKHSIAAAKEAKQRRKSRIMYSIVAVVIVLVFVFIFTYNSTWPSKHMTAVTINGEEYSVAQLNYYYNASYMSFYNNYYYYIMFGYFFDTSTSLADQEYSDGYSWRDYFIDAAVDSMVEIQLLNEEAEAAGFELPDEYLEEYNESLESLQTTWEDNGYSSLAQFLNMNYGKGVTYELVEQELYRTYVASAYSDYIYDSFEYSTEDLDDYYAEHADEFDMITYAYYTITDDEIDADAVVEAVDGTTEEDLTSYMEENYEVTPTTLTYDGSSLPSAYSEWLLDSARVSGDATAITSDDTTYVVMFLDRDTNDYYMTNFRHVLISAEDTDGDGEYSEDEIAAAHDEAQEIYDEWLAGDATEDSFAELANTYSDDTGSNEDGGLYEEVYKNYMVDPIDEWLFEDGRTAGDTAIVDYDGSSYTGTHILYFVGTDADLTYAESLADSTLRSDDYSSWIADAESNYTAVTSHLGLVAKTH